MSENVAYDLGEDRSILLVDDDEPFLKRLARAMEKRGFEVETADSVAGGKAIATGRPRPMRSSICVLATATGSTSWRRCANGGRSRGSSC